MTRSSGAMEARRENGFTMIELLVTMLLLAIVMTGLAALQVHAIRQTSATRRANEATRLGQDTLERYLVAPYGPISTQTWAIENNRASQPMSGVGADGVSKGPYTVESKVDASSTGKLITVRVSWRDAEAKAATAQTRQVYLTTLRTP